MTDREKLEKARELVGDVQGNLAKGNAWADADCAMDYISDVLRALPEPERFVVVPVREKYSTVTGTYAKDVLDRETGALIEPLSPEQLCDLLNRGHEANDV